MSIEIPYFRFRRKSPNKFAGCIEMGNEVIHQIANTDTLYEYFGYSVKMAENGVMPEEFIWDTFLKYNQINCGNCFQLHIIEYLLKHEPAFVQKFWRDCDKWIAVHAEKRDTCAVNDCADRKNSFQTSSQPSAV